VSSRERTPAGTAIALVAASHPVPTVAVSALATAVASAAGRTSGGVALVALAVLTGQLSIGWCNDLVDVARDRAAGRRDKPLARGDLSTRLTATACGTALLACIPLSFASGPAAGAAHLVAVAGGWSYNLVLKRTVWSFAPFAVSFGLLAAFIAYGLPGAPAPAWWAVAAAALLGVGAHFLNVVPDVAADLAAGVRGLPQRLGPRRSAVAGAALLLGATALVVLGPAGGTPVWGWAVLGMAGVAASLAVAATTRPRSGRTPFLLAVVTAVLAVVALVARGGDLT
jgi:4-hydroxybenzoate polyprenyltransferase